MPLTDSPFRAAWWLPGGHAQTIQPVLLRRRVGLEVRTERLELTDGDFLDLAWGPAPRRPLRTANGTTPLVLVSHGLEGSIRSGYVRGLLRALADRGLRGVLLHSRGCSGEPNRLPRGYHACETGDLAEVIERLANREPATPLAAVGYSLGGSALLHHLAEAAGETPLKMAVAVSVPYRLEAADARLNHGLSRLYQAWLMRQLRRSLARKSARMALPVEIPPRRRLNRFRAFDDAVTAPLHGFRDAADYYARCSSRPVLAAITTPTHLIHAQDDPFMSPDCVPGADELSPHVALELSRHGGHVGFVEGRTPFAPGYYLERRIPDLLVEAFTDCG